MPNYFNLIVGDLAPLRLKEWDDPALLTDVIVSRPLRGNGSEEKPYRRTVRLTTTQGKFICEIDEIPSA